MSSLRRVVRCAPLLAVPLLVAGCTPAVHSFPLGDPVAAARPTRKQAMQPVPIYLERTPRCAYTELARLTVTPRPYSAALWTETVAALLRARARDVGADAIVGLREVRLDGGSRLIRSGGAQRTGDSTSRVVVLAETTAVEHDHWRTLVGMVVRVRDGSCRE